MHYSRTKFPGNLWIQILGKIPCLVWSKGFTFTVLISEDSKYSRNVAVIGPLRKEIIFVGLRNKQQTYKLQAAFSTKLLVQIERYLLHVLFC